MVVGVARLRPFDLGHDTGGDLGGNLILQVQQILDRAIVPISPDMVSVSCLDQLAGDAYAVAAVPDRPAQEVSRIERSPQACRIVREYCWIEIRCGGDHDQFSKSGKLGDDVLGDAVPEIAAVGGGVELGERQHGDRRTINHNTVLRR